MKFNETTTCRVGAAAWKMVFLVFPDKRGIGREHFDLQPRVVRIIRIGFWLTLFVGAAAAVLLVIFSYNCGIEYNYWGNSYIPVLWFIQAILLGFAILFVGILYYAKSDIRTT